MSEIEVRKPTEEELEQMGVKGWPIWECDPSTFDWEYTDKETCYILEGDVTVSTPSGDVHFAEGDLVVFPEGTRTRDGSIGRLRGGILLLARDGGVPIVPVVITGAFELWPRNRKLPRFGTVCLAFGEPIHVAPSDSLKPLLRRLVRAMEELKEELEERKGRFQSTEAG